MAVMRGKRNKKMALFVFFHSFLELQLRLRSFVVVAADACERYTGLLLRFNKAVGKYGQGQKGTFQDRSIGPI